MRQYAGHGGCRSTPAQESEASPSLNSKTYRLKVVDTFRAEVGGGVTLWRNGQELALVELPIVGLMSDRSAREVADKAQALVAAMADCGCTLNNAYMQHSPLALVVIPELRISDKGLIDVTRFAVTDLLVAEA